MVCSAVARISCTSTTVESRSWLVLVVFCYVIYLLTHHISSTATSFKYSDARALVPRPLPFGVSSYYLIKFGRIVRLGTT